MSDLISQISRHLRTVAEVQHIALKTGLLPLVQSLQKWQTLRMQATHQALLNDPHHAPALRFFVEQIYGPQNFGQRDADIVRVVPKMHKYMPDKALSSLASALRLQALSFELDYAVAVKLKEQATSRLILIDRQSYAQAYLAGENLPLRQEQIALLNTLGVNLRDAVAVKGVTMMLALSKHPAKVKGLHTLHQFLQSGFKAFKKIPNSELFMQDIVTKEQCLMSLLFAQRGGNPLPYVPNTEITLET
tara:strand:+ start:1270 stop:2010 length:741 start_codon:yes stop_codon:yes gene_type:complete